MKWKLVTAGAIVTCAVLASMVAIGGAPFQGHRRGVIVDNPVQKVHFTEAQLRAVGHTPVPTFRLKNPGRRPIRLGEPTTTCGCTVLGDFQDTLGPRETAELRAEVRPPSIGKREVRIRVPTNTPGQEVIDLQVHISVDASLPILVSKPRAVRLFGVKELSESRDFEVETFEGSGTEHWIESTTTSAGFVSVVLQEVTEESAELTDVVKRTYKFEVKLKKLIGLDESYDVVWLQDREGKSIGDQATGPIAVLVSTSPPIRIRPKRLYAQWSPGSSLPRWTIAVQGREGGPAPKVLDAKTD